MRKLRIKIFEGIVSFGGFTFSLSAWRRFRAVKLRAMQPVPVRLHQRSRRGTTAVEMALLMPIFLFLFVGMVEISLVITAQVLLENATYNASRLAKTGYTNSGQSQLATVQKVLNDELQSFGTLIDVSKVTLTSMAYNSFSGSGSNSGGTTGMGSQGQIVVYTITYPWTLFTPMMSSVIGTNGVLSITSHMVVRNEPYG